MRFMRIFSAISELMENSDDLEIRVPVFRMCQCHWKLHK